jgi:hypothetical protein
MPKPILLAAIWLLALTIFSWSLPVLALAGRLGGGLLILSGLAVGVASGVALVAYSILWTVRTRPSFVMGATSVGAPVVAGLLASLLLPVWSELSWQLMYGPRDVLIWSY